MPAGLVALAAQVDLERLQPGAAQGQSAAGKFCSKGFMRKTLVKSNPWRLDLRGRVQPGIFQSAALAATAFAHQKQAPVGQVDPPTGTGRMKQRVDYWQVTGNSFTVVMPPCDQSCIRRHRSRIHVASAHPASLTSEIKTLSLPILPVPADRMMAFTAHSAF